MGAFEEYLKKNGLSGTNQTSRQTGSVPSSNFGKYLRDRGLEGATEPTVVKTVADVNSGLVRTKSSVESDLNRAKNKRDGQSKKVKALEEGLRFGAVDPTVLSNLHNRATADARKYNDDYNKYRAELYKLENDQALEKIGGDAQAQESYAAGQQARSDMRTLLESMLPTSIPGTDLPAGYQDTVGRQNRSNYNALQQKYGARDAVGLAARIKAGERQVASDLEGRGYNFDRMVDYEQRLKDAEARAAERKENREFADEHSFLSSATTVAVAPVQGLDYLSIAGQSIQNELRGEDDWRPVNTDKLHATNYVTDVRGRVGENIENNTELEVGGQNVARFLYDTGMSMADSATAIAFAGPAATYLLGGAAASKTAMQVLENGGSGMQATMSGLAAGAAEAIFEKYSIDALLEPRNISSVKRLLTGTLKQAGVEASEEMATEISNILTNALIMGQNSDFNRSVEYYMSEEGGSLSAEEAKKRTIYDCLGQIVWAGVGGALSGGVMSVGANTMQLADNAEEARRVYGYSPETLISQTLAADADNQLAKKLQDRVRNKQNVSGLQLSTLNEQRQTAFEKQEAAQKKRGESGKLTIERASQKYGKQAEAMKTTYNSDQDVEKFDEAFNAMHNMAKLGVAYDIAIDDESVSYLTSQQKKLAYDIGRAADGAVELADVVNEYEISEDGKTVHKGTDTVVELGEVVSVDGGTMTFALADGSEAVSTELSYGTEDEAVLYSAVNYAANTAAEANALINGFKSSGMSAADYSKGIRSVFNYGRHNLPVGQMEKIREVKALPADVRKAAYEAGKQLREHRTKQRQAELDKLRAETPAKGKVGRVLRLTGTQQVQTFREHQTQNGQKLTEVQEASIYGMERLAALMGVDMYVFESYVNENGERVYTDENGREYAAPNGYYENGKVYIDLNAGDRGEGTMLYTVSHELTHFIQEWSPAKYDVLCEVILDGYARQGISVDQLIRNQIVKAKENGRDIRYEEAFDEVIADSMESMLADGRVVELMADIKRRDRNLWEKIRDFFADLLEDLKLMVNAYKHHKPNSKEGRMVADMQEVIDAIQPIFAEALVDAGETYQAAATKNTAEDGGVKYQARAFAEQVDEVLAGEFERTNAVYMGETPKILGEVGLNGDLPMLTTARHLKNACMPKDAKKHHHGLTEGQVKRLPMAIAEPVIILDSLGTTPNCIVVVTDMLDPDKLPVIVAIRTDGTGMYNNVEIDTNFVLSYYGRTEFADYLDRHITAGNLLYYNKEKSETLSNRANVQFVGQLDAYRSDTILRKTKAKVNRKNSFRRATAIDGVAQAEQMERDGRNRSDIWYELGIIRDAAGNWVAEIDDSDAKFYAAGDARLQDNPDWMRYKELEGKMINRTITDEEHRELKELSIVVRVLRRGSTLQDYLKHDELYRAAPYLKNIPFRMGIMGGRTKGKYNKSGITVDNGQDADERLSTTLHEAQHAIQDEEGRPGGASPEYWQSRLYNGEIIRKNDKRIAAARDRRDAAWDKMSEALKSKVREINRESIAAKDSGNYDRLTELQTALFNSEDADLYAEYDDALWEERLYSEYNEPLSAQNLYYQTAGEIEAQLVQQRRSMTAEQRRAKMPNFQWDDAVFAEKNQRRYSERNYSYDELVAKSNIQGRVIPKNRTVQLTADGSIDKQWIVSEVLKQCESIATKAPVPTYFVNVTDIGKNVEVTSEGISHGFIRRRAKNGKSVPENSLINARVALDLPWILQNSVEVNRSKRDGNNEVEFAHIMIGVSALENADGDVEYYVVRSVVEARKNQGAILTEANVIGKLHAMKAKKINASPAQDGKTVALVGNAFEYTVSDLLDNVKQIYDDTFSNDVYAKLGMQRTDNDFSKHLMYSDRNRKTAAALERENQRLKEDVEYLRELVRLQKKVTNGTRMKRRDVENMAKLLMKNNSIKGDYRELTPMLTELYEFMAINENIDADAIREKAQPAVNWMLDHVQNKSPLDPYAEEILGVLKSSSVRFSDNQKAEAAYLYDGWGKYRNSIIGAVHVTDKATQTLDQLWADLAESYPKTFNADISDAQQPAALMEVIEELRNMKEESFDFDPALLEQGFLQDVYDGYWRVSTLDTVADNYQRRIDELKKKHMQEMEESKAMLFKAMNQQRMDYKRAMEGFLAREAEEIHKQKTEYAADRRKAVEKRRKTARKKSIQKTAQKLDALLNRGTKEKNIKEGMQEFVGRALTAANAIMQTDNELDYIRFGVAVELTTRERKIYDEAKELLNEIDRYWDEHDTYDSYDEIKKAVKGLERRLSELKELHGREIAARKKLGMEVSEEFTVLDMLKEPVHCFISNREAQVMQAATEMLHKVYQLKPHEVGMYTKMKQAESKLNYRMKMLSDVFERERNRRDKMTVSTVLNDLAASYEALEGATGYLSGAFDVVVRDYLKTLNDKIGSTNIKDMSLWQLESIDEAFTMVLTTVNNVNEAFTDERKRNIEEMGEAAMGELGRQKQIKELEVKGAGVLKRLHWNNLKPVYAFERIGSTILKERFDAVRKGEDVYARDITEARQFYLRQARKYGAMEWDLEERITFQDADGREFKLNRDQMMSIYAYARRKQAHEHLLQGGIVFDEHTEIKGEKIYGVPVTMQPTKANTHRINSDVLQKIGETLTEEQRLFAQEMQDYLSTDMANKGNEVSVRMYGVKLFKEQHYFPLHSATQFNRKAAEQQEAGEHSPRRLKNNGMTKAVTPEANNPIILSGFMDTWSGHVDEMSMYHAFVLPLEDFNRVFKYMTPTTKEASPTSVDAAIQNAHGKAATEYITQLVNDLNGGARSDSRETPMKSLVAKWKKAAVFTSMSVVVQQPSAIGRAFAMVDPKYFRPSDFVTFGKEHSDVWREMKKYAPVSIIKEMGYFDTNMGQSTTEFLKKKEYKEPRDKLVAFVKDSQYRDDALSFLPAYADEMTWCTIWGAVKREQMELDPKADATSEAFLQKCGERFTEVIQKTQVYDSVLARSGNMRSKSLYMNMLTAFMAEPTTSINMVEDAVYKMVRGGDKQAGAKQIAAVVASVILNSVLVSFVYAARDDDEDETYLEKYLTRLVEETADGLNPLTYLPIVKDVWSVWQGYDVERADMSLVADVVDAINNLRRLSEKDTSDMEEAELDAHIKDMWEARLEFVDYATAFAGISFKNVRRDFNAIFNLGKTLYKDATERDTTLLSLSDAVLPVIGFQDEKTKTDKLYYATVKGDTGYVKRLNATFETEKARNTAIRKALRANDPRVKEAAVLYVKGDYEKYRQVYNKILNEKKFSQDNIINAIQAEIKVLTPDEATEDTVAKIEGLFNEDNYVQSLLDGKTGTAETIKQDVIGTYVANGSTRDEAEKKFVSSTRTAIKNRYMDYGLSDDIAYHYFTAYTGMDETEATNRVKAYSWMREHPQYEFTVNEALSYTSPIEGLGVSAEGCGIPPNTYADYLDAASACVGVDSNGDGKADRNSKKKQILAVIDALPISDSQKDALYIMNGWSKSNLRKAPWH